MRWCTMPTNPRDGLGLLLNAHEAVEEIRNNEDSDAMWGASRWAAR
jgi:hypothetical protein